MARRQRQARRIRSFILARIARVLCVSSCRSPQGSLMRRRTFFGRILGSIGAAFAAPDLNARSSPIVIQRSPVAGFQFYRGEAVWEALSVGAELRLVREASNRHDPDAVAVYFGDEKLGYLPRAENRSIAQMLDRGERLEIKIERLSKSEDPWKRILVTVCVLA